MKINIDTVKERLFLVLLLLISLVYFSGVIPFLSFSDELLLIIAFLYVVYEVCFLRLYSHFAIVTFSYVIYAFFVAVMSPFNPDLIYSFFQSLIHIKVLLIAYFAISVFNAVKSKRLFIKLFKLLTFLYFSSLILNMVMGEAWNNFVGFYEQQYRYGFLRPAGIFSHYAPNSYFFTLIVTTLMLTFDSAKANVFSYHFKKFILFVFIDFFAAFPLTVRKGIVVLIPYFFYVISILKPKLRLIVIMGIAIFISSLLWLISDSQIFTDTLDNLDKFFRDDHSYVRGIIVYHGYSLFSDFFPIGVGAGLYGTVFSNMNLSVYEYVDMNMVLFTSDVGGLKGVYDSGLAALAAEMGFIGLIFVSYLTYLLMKSCSVLTSNSNLKIIKLLTVYMLLLAVTEPVLQNGFFAIFYCISVLYIISHGTSEFEYARR